MSEEISSGTCTWYDAFGHFALEKTLNRLWENYWFPKMRKYVERYIAYCIHSIFNKKTSDRKGYFHTIPKLLEPFNMIHIDHLGPFAKSKKNVYLIVEIYGFIKFTFLKAVRSTQTKYVVDYCKDTVSTYGIPKNIITDRGTSKSFKGFCFQNNIRHVLNVVATPRTPGKVERLNRTILEAMLISILEEELLDEQVDWKNS